MAHKSETNTDSSDVEEGKRRSVNDDSETQELPHSEPYLRELLLVPRTIRAGCGVVCASPKTPRFWRSRILRLI